MRPALAALACLFLAAHLAYLPSTPEDIDSVNFALGVTDFDVARHQPHPPGYPVYIALSKAAASLLGGTADSRAVVLALALWSVISGALLIALLFAFFRGLDGNERRAWWAMAITVSSPLFWFTALRPLSDMTGLAAAVGAQALLVPVITGHGGERARTLLVAGAFVTGIAAGIRAQTLVLTTPLLVAALVLPRTGVTLRARAAAVLAGLAAVVMWAVPLLVASGGLGGYLAALGTQAGEDFAGVVMLWTTKTPRVALDAFTYSFLWPWGGLVLGAIVLFAAAVGALRLMWRAPRVIVWLAIAFGPYAVFHLLFHETATVRYALPLVPPVAFLAASAFDWAGRRPAMLLGVALVTVSLLNGAAASRGYDSGAPAFQAMRRVSEAQDGAAVGMHAVFRRTAEWTPPTAPSGRPRTILRARHGGEWLALVDRWRAEPGATIAFVSDPRRTDLALFDPHGRELQASYRWRFPELPYVGGIRPGNADVYLMRSPGWMLDRGWALSAEVGGVSAREGAGPHVQPSIAWVRGRREPALLMVGGRNLDAAAATDVTLSNGGVVLDRWTVPAGFFFRLLPVPAGTLDGDGYVPLSVQAASAAGQVRVSLEQFDVQSDGTVMSGFIEGWQEPEYNPRTARSWRWMSERATVWARPIGRDVELRLSGESPLRYYDSAPTVRVSLGGQELVRFSPTADFTERVRLPAKLLQAVDGRVVIESDRWFVPADRDGSADKRHLALRIYELGVTAADGSAGRTASR